MRSLDGYLPRRGLSIPLLTALDRSGRFDEASERRLVRHAISEGFGADILFVGGTTGEALGLSAPLRETLTEAVLDEARAARVDRPVEVWAGVTARSAGGALDLLSHAVRAGADAVGIAPLSIADLQDIAGFFQHEVREALEGSGRMIPVFLYDNADLSVDPKVPHLKTALVKRLSRLEFVRGIKVSAPIQVLGHYAKAAGHFNARGAFGIYTGNARLIFDLFDTEKGPFRRHLDRFLLSSSLPVGVVAGQANALPREWQNAWRVCLAGDDRASARYGEAFARLSAACRPGGGPARSVACLKRALFTAGVLASDAVAPGTPPLAGDDAPAFDRVFEEVRKALAQGVPERWVTPWAVPVPERVAP